jgi:flagellar protein FliJ
MKAFFFRLETLLAVRRSREKALKRELEHTNGKLSQIQEKEKMLQAQIGSLIEEMRKKQVEGKLSLRQTYSQILEHLNATLAQVQHNLVAQKRQMEEQKGRLKQAIRERKVIEKIKEKHYASWRMRELQSEGALLDEIALKKPTGIK